MLPCECLPPGGSMQASSPLKVLSYKRKGGKIKRCAPSSAFKVKSIGFGCRLSVGSLGGSVGVQGFVTSLAGSLSRGRLLLLLSWGVECVPRI